MMIWISCLLVGEEITTTVRTQEDKEKAKFARNANLKKVKGQKALTVDSKPAACPILTKRAVTVPIRVRDPQSITPISQCATAKVNRQDVLREESTTVTENIVLASKPSTTFPHATSTLEQNALVTTIPVSQDTRCEKITEELARQERDLKSSKS
ncbi:hypothetical protein ACMFMG_010984 [Clarireedia jacksonii]